MRVDGAGAASVEVYAPEAAAIAAGTYRAKPKKKQVAPDAPSMYALEKKSKAAKKDQTAQNEAALKAKVFGRR